MGKESFSFRSRLGSLKTPPPLLRLTGQHFGPVVVLGLEVQVVLAVLEELRGGHVHADLDLARVARDLDRLVDEVEPLLVGADVGGKAALVADVAGVLACWEMGWLVGVKRKREKKRKRQV